MKDKEDKKTLEMDYETEVTSPDEGRTAGANYRAWIVTTDGIRIVWTHLTRRQALALHKLNIDKVNILQSSTEVTRCGWEEM